MPYSCPVCQANTDPVTPQSDYQMVFDIDDSENDPMPNVVVIEFVCRRDSRHRFWVVSA